MQNFRSNLRPLNNGLEKISPIFTVNTKEPLFTQVYPTNNGILMTPSVNYYINEKFDKIVITITQIDKLSNIQEVVFNSNNINTTQGYHNNVSLPNVESFFQNCIMLPMNFFLNDDDVHYVCDRVFEFYRN